MRPPLYLLQALAAFQEGGTVEKAAVILETTQPTVTRQLQQLEEWSRAPLFESMGRKKVLTEYGSVLAQVFDRHFQNFALDVRRARQRFAKLEQQTLRICAPDATLAENFSGLDFPGLLQFVALTDGDILREITHQTADVAVLASHVDAENYVVRRLSTARVQLLMPKTWSPDVPSYKETARLCANHDYCAGTWGDDIEDLLVETLELPARPVARTVCTDWSTVEARVHAQRAWALIPSDSAKEGRGYWHIELPDSFRGQTSFIYVLRSVAAASWFQTASAGIW